MVELTYIVSRVETFGIILHEDGVVEVEVENVTTLASLSHLLQIFKFNLQFSHSNQFN